MTSEWHERNVNPIIKELAAAGPGESVVELEGYLGPAEKGTLRLYKKLDITEYLEVADDSVLGCTAIPDDDGGRVKLYVKAAAQMKTVTARVGAVKEFVDTLSAELEATAGRATRLTSHALEDKSAAAAELAEESTEMVATLASLNQLVQKAPPWGASAAKSLCDKLEDLALRVDKLINRIRLGLIEVPSRIFSELIDIKFELKMLRIRHCM